MNSGDMEWKAVTDPLVLNSGMIKIIYYIVVVIYTCNIIYTPRDAYISYCSYIIFK